MPRLLGMEPEKWKPIAIVGGVGIVAFIYLKSKSAAPIAASMPDGGPQLGVSSPAAQTEVSGTQQIAQGLQSGLQAVDTAQQQAMNALSLQSQKQQLDFQGQQDQFQLSREMLQAKQQDAITHENFKQLKQKGQTGGFFGGLMGFINQAAADVGAFTGGVNAASQAAQAVHNFGTPSPRQVPTSQQQAPSPSVNTQLAMPNMNSLNWRSGSGQ